jgi:type I restriction-modification system DNA methylase subunit
VAGPIRALNITIGLTCFARIWLYPFCVVTLDEIAANDHNLNIPRYIEPTTTQKVLTVEQAMIELGKTAEAAFKAEERLVSLLVTNELLR